MCIRDRFRPPRGVALGPLRSVPIHSPCARQSPIDIDLDLPTCSRTEERGPDGIFARSEVASYKEAS
eukprot:14354326-Alexandrium_andersonii.AAC.1